MLGNPLLGWARWMARRNGEALARSVATQLRRYAGQGPERLSVNHWEELLNNRPGWHRVRQYVYEFRTGQRIELKAKADPLEIIRWMANAELQPLAAGLNASLQDQLLKESITAALERWRQNAEGKVG